MKSSIKRKFRDGPSPVNLKRKLRLSGAASSLAACARTPVRRAPPDRRAYAPWPELPPAPFAARFRRVFTFFDADRCAHSCIPLSERAIGCVRVEISPRGASSEGGEGRGQRERQCQGVLERAHDGSARGGKEKWRQEDRERGARRAWRAQAGTGCEGACAVQDGPETARDGGDKAAEALQRVGALR